MAQTGTVIPQGLNLRETPGGTVITVLPQGATVEILEDQGDFLKVKELGQIGFVKASLISRTGAAGGSFHFEGNNAVAPDGTVFGKKFQQGIFNVGDTSIADFVGANQAAFPSLHPTGPGRFGVRSPRSGPKDLSPRLLCSPIRSIRKEGCQRQQPDAGNALLYQ